MSRNYYCYDLLPNLATVKSVACCTAKRMPCARLSLVFWIAFRWRSIMTEQAHLPIEDKFKAAIKAVEPNPEFSESLWQHLSRKQAGKPQISLVGTGFFRTLRTVTLAL